MLTRIDKTYRQASVQMKAIHAIALCLALGLIGTLAAAEEIGASRCVTVAVTGWLLFGLGTISASGTGLIRVLRTYERPVLALPMYALGWPVVVWADCQRRW